MEPGSNAHWRNMRLGIDVVCWNVAAGQGGELFRVPLLHHAEATKLAFLAIEAAMVVGVAGDEAVAADVIEGCHLLHNVHRKRQPRYPGSAVALVQQIEFGRWGVFNLSLSAKVVDGL